MVVDSTSWLPRPLEEIGRSIGIPKPDLPANDDSDDAWRVRCAGDVRILAAAMLQLLNYWATNQLGRWRATGPSCGFAAMRHLLADRSILIHPSDEWSDIEHAAIYGGYRWTGRVGELTGGAYCEVDFTRAYTTIAAHLPLPVSRVYIDKRPTIDRLERDTQFLGAIADATITTSVPRYPVRVSGIIYYPVGEFRTILAGDDLKHAIRNGDIRCVHRVAYYRLGVALQEWARWILGILDDTTGPHNAVVQIAAKGWSRSVIGKFAARTPEFHDLGYWPRQEFGIEPYMELPSGKVGYAIYGGERLIAQVGGRDTDNSLPAILAFIEAATRSRIISAIERVGWRRIITADTDGIIVDMADLITAYIDARPEIWQYATASYVIDRILDDLAEYTRPLRARLKALNRHLNVSGPQHIVGDTTRKLSGVSRHAQETDNGTYRFHAWPSIIYQSSNSRPGEYVRPLREIRISRIAATGHVTDDGYVEPWTATIGADGATQIERRAQLQRWHDIDLAYGKPGVGQIIHPRVPLTVSHAIGRSCK